MRQENTIVFRTTTGIVSMYKIGLHSVVPGTGRERKRECESLEDKNEFEFYCKSYINHFRFHLYNIKIVATSRALLFLEAAYLVKLHLISST